MSKDDVKFEAPASVADAQLRRRELSQLVREVDAELTAVNNERPPRIQTHNYQHWVQRRGGLIGRKRHILAEIHFVRQWLAEASSTFFDTELGRPSVELHTLANCMKRLEELYIAVGLFLESNSDNSFDAVQQAYDTAKAELGEDVAGLED